MPTRRPATAVALALGIALGFAACSNDDSSGDRTATAQPPSETPTATATRAPEPRPTPTARPAIHIGLDTSPKLQPPEVARVLGPKPASTFPAWDGKSTVIYDVQTGKTLDLGPGSQPASFSPDGTKAAWAAGGDFAQGTEVFVLDLPNGQPRSLGAGRMAQFLDNSSVVVFSVGENERTIVDVGSGARRPYANEPLGPSLGHFRWTAPEGYRLDPSDVTSPGTVRTFTLYNAQTGNSVLSFDAMSVAAAGANELAVAAPPIDERSNIYVVEIATGQATFVATAKPGRDNWPFSATADAVVWTDEFCSLDPGPVTLFDRKAGQIVRIDTGEGEDGRWMLLTRTGLLASGTFGADALIDPWTLEYVSVIPNGPDISWSGDYRYASHGPYGGHGGLCGPG